ncbi:TIGR00299 family protein [Marvinbryantia formatexigens DSM 14469]|uniref:Pyridinium-3,5-bisthiocarboxylic acid mononucleotide nickel insertion protein n=2 Tax=Marvinbryantia TaxID=248744 RepID=C6LJS4_9FIRM|nr:TIGR00299 family protein [Marvinbryantia formatexigens DSM 14469]
MTLGALLDLGVDEQKFLQELDKLHVEGYHIKIEETDKNGIRAKHVNVCVDGVPEESGDIHLNGHEHGKASGHEHTHTHDHAHPHRNFADIRRMIEQSALEENVRELALRIFGRVAAAEAKVHGKSIDEVHFHEVGAVDSIIDIVGCAILINMIKPDKICASVLHEGHGFVRCQHGLLSVPVPATSEILAAAGAPLAQIDIEGELITPTGAAIITELAEHFGVMPGMRITRTGWGAGTKNLPVPNVLRVYQGTAIEAEGAETGRAPESTDADGLAEKRAGQEENTDYVQDEILVLEANLDDCTGEMLGAAMGALLEEGALDVFYTPIYMKKNRPAYRLTVLAKPQDGARMERLMFRHTTTIGIRRRTEMRSILKREQVQVNTPCGKMAAKKVYLGEEERIYPEYESAVKLAAENGKSLWEIYRSYGKS